MIFCYLINIVIKTVAISLVIFINAIIKQNYIVSLLIFKKTTSVQKQFIKLLLNYVIIIYTKITK